MPLLVDGTEVPQSWIEEEAKRVQTDPRLREIPESERDGYVREAAEYAAVGRVLIELAAQQDSRPVFEREIAAEVERVRRSSNCRAGFEAIVRTQAEHRLRVQRLISELTSSARQPTEAEVENFYTANRDNFRIPGTFQAAHIIKHDTKEKPAPEARMGIEAALAALEGGENFAPVADRHSDCSGNGGDLGTFQEGFMVEEFERALSCIEPGQRTGIFQTAFGHHIAELRARTPGRPALFEETKHDIARILFGMRQHAALQEGVEQMRAKANIVRT